MGCFKTCTVEVLQLDATPGFWLAKHIPCGTDYKFAKNDVIMFQILPQNTLATILGCDILCDDEEAVHIATNERTLIGVHFMVRFVDLRSQKLTKLYLEVLMLFYYANQYFHLF